MLDSNEALKKARNMKGESFRKGLRDGIPIALGYFAVSFTFGMMAVADGLSTVSYTHLDVYKRQALNDSAKALVALLTKKFKTSS